MHIRAHGTLGRRSMESWFLLPSSVKYLAEQAEEAGMESQTSWAECFELFCNKVTTLHASLLETTPPSQQHTRVSFTEDAE